MTMPARSPLWRMYDELIEGIPGNVAAEDVLVGRCWTLVNGPDSAGLAMTSDQPGPGKTWSGGYGGATLRDVAALCRSWDFLEATIGMAAVNAWYNAPSRLRALGVLPPDDEADNRVRRDAFKSFAPRLAGKNVTVVGHFPYLERTLAPFCRLTILERRPQDGDMPDTACEYILPQQDFVFMTGVTFLNKTLPRLLQIVGGTVPVCMVGPTVPMAPAMFGYGIDDLDGFCATDRDALKTYVGAGGCMDLFEYGKKIRFGREDLKPATI
mgnify:CR=1 FL=1